MTFFSLTLHCIFFLFNLNVFLITLRLRPLVSLSPELFVSLFYALELNVGYDVKTRDYFLNCFNYISKNDLDSCLMCHPVVTVHTYVPKTTDFNYSSAVESKVIAQIWSIACEEWIQFHSGSEKQNSGKKDELNQLITLLSWTLLEAAASVKFAQLHHNHIRLQNKLIAN